MAATGVATGEGVVVEHAVSSFHRLIVYLILDHIIGCPDGANDNTEDHGDDYNDLCCTG